MFFNACKKSFNITIGQLHMLKYPVQKWKFGFQMRKISNVPKQSSDGRINKNVKDIKHQLKVN